MHQDTLIGVLVVGVVIFAAGCQRAAQPPKPPMADEETMQVVNVVTKEFAFEPRQIQVKAGVAKFVVRN